VRLSLFPFVGSTPPLNIRDGQHFTDWNVNVFDPLTTRLCTAADKCPSGVQYARDPFPNNMIPTARISPIGKKILDLYPAPNGNFGNLQNNFLAGPAIPAATGMISPWDGGDHNFGPNDRFYSLVTFPAWLGVPQQ